MVGRGDGSCEGEGLGLKVIDGADDIVGIFDGFVVGELLGLIEERGTIDGDMEDRKDGLGAMDCSIGDSVPWYCSTTRLPASLRCPSITLDEAHFVKIPRLFEVSFSIFIRPVCSCTIPISNPTQSIISKP